MPKKTSLAVRLARANFSAEEIAAALAEDRKVKRILRKARTRPQGPMLVEKTRRENAAIMAEFRAATEVAMLARIERAELITKDELIQRLGGNRRWVDSAIVSGRIFSLQSPSGVDYFPAFFADSPHRRRHLGMVARVLASLPGASRYHFFVSKSLVLGMTPLEALAEGRVKSVVDCASGFATR
jgi:hypothetical protein